MNYPKGPGAGTAVERMQEASTRLFVALWPDPALRARVSNERDAWRWPLGAKPVADAKLHLTLHFIGAFQRARIAALEDSLAALRLAPTTLHASGREIWRGGIAVLLFSADAELSTLHAAIGDVLAGFAVALDLRPFSPHVTLARRARGAASPAERVDLEWEASGFALLESLRGGYRVLRTFGDAEGDHAGEGRANVPM
jgi:2'-5' RNA ligase